MSNIFSRIAQLFSSSKEKQCPQNPQAQAQAQAPTPQGVSSECAASCARPAINLTHIDLPTAPSLARVASKRYAKQLKEATPKHSTSSLTTTLRDTEMEQIVQHLNG